MIDTAPSAAHSLSFSVQSSAKLFVLQSTSEGGRIQARSSPVTNPQPEPGARRDPRARDARRSLKLATDLRIAHASHALPFGSFAA
jgi:hypothetical protein